MIAQDIKSTVTKCMQKTTTGIFFVTTQQRATKAPRHQDDRIILYYNFFNPDKSGLKLMRLRLINEKTPLFNLYLSPLWVFVPLAQTWHAMLSYSI